MLVADGQAQVAPWRWSAGSRLIDYTSTPPNAKSKGQKLQAALFLPADYQPGVALATTMYSFDSSGEKHSPFGRPTSPVATAILPVWPSTR